MKSWRWFDGCYLVSCFNVDTLAVIRRLLSRKLFWRWNAKRCYNTEISHVVATLKSGRCGDGVISYVDQTLQCPTLFQPSYPIRSDWQRCFNARKATLKRITERSIRQTLKSWLHFNVEFRRLLSQPYLNVNWMMFFRCPIVVIPHQRSLNNIVCCSNIKLKVVKMSSKIIKY